MSLYSEATMQKWFRTREIPVADYYEMKKPDAKGTVKPVFHSSLTPAEWFNRAKDLMLEGQQFHTGQWEGTGTQNASDMVHTGLINEAVKAFESAVAEIDTHLAHGSPELHAVGSAFSIGRIMSGHPKAAIVRPRTKLPPKSIDLTLNAWAGLKAEDIARSMSKIAKAAWQYISAGGIIELRVSYLHNFTQPQVWNGIEHWGFLDTLKINPMSMAAFASAASGQMYRALSIPIALKLSGQHHDGLPLGKWCNPATHAIQGNKADDAVIQSLRIR